MDDEVLSASESRRVVAVGVQPASIGVKRVSIVNLLVKGDARIGAEKHKCSARRAVLASHNVRELVTGRGGARVEQALDVNPPLAFVLEFEMVVKPLVACDFAQRFRYPG